MLLPNPTTTTSLTVTETANINKETDKGGGGSLLNMAVDLAHDRMENLEQDKGKLLLSYYI